MTTIEAMLKDLEAYIERHRASLPAHARIAFDKAAAFSRSMALYGHGIAPNGEHHVNAPDAYLIFPSGTTCTHCGNVVA